MRNFMASHIFIGTSRVEVDNNPAVRAVGYSPAVRGAKKVLVAHDLKTDGEARCKALHFT